VSARRLAPVALCALLAVTALVAGCGGSGSSAPPAIGDLAQVADRTADARTASFTVRVDQSLGSQALSISASGAFDAAAGRARLSVDLSGLAKGFAGLGAALGATGAGFDDPARWKLEAIRDGVQVYASSPLLAPVLPPGKTWLSGDLAKIAAEYGVDPGQLGSLGGGDPRDLLDLLRATSGGLERVGTDSLRGVETTHYRAELNPKQALGLVGKGAGAGLVDSLAGAIQRAGLERIPVDVWVDGDSLLRRLDANVSLEHGGRESTSRLSVELFDYGEPVDVTPPPAAEVAGLDELR
jgi:hypothetical protein